MSKEHISLKEFQKNFIEELKQKRWETYINLKALTEILPTMQETRERLQKQRDITQEAITMFQQDPSREAREKRQKEEAQLKVWDERLKKQGEEIDKTIQRNEDLEKTIENLDIFIKTSESNL